VYEGLIEGGGGTPSRGSRLTSRKDGIGGGNLVGKALWGLWSESKKFSFLGWKNIRRYINPLGSLGHLTKPSRGNPRGLHGKGKKTKVQRKV